MATNQNPLIHLDLIEDSLIDLAAEFPVANRYVEAVGAMPPPMRVALNRLVAKRLVTKQVWPVA